MAAALGGMVAPALIYLAFNAGGEGAHGWGIPMATDIAFAVAVVTAVGPRVPAGIRVLLLSIAIVDDLGAIVVIAAFYTEHLSLWWLAAAVALLGCAWAMQRRHVRSLLPYMALGCLTWLCLHESGVHATLAGVGFGLLAPAWSWHDPGRFAARARPLVSAVDNALRQPQVTEAEYEVVRASVRSLRELAVETESPLERITWRLSPVTTYGVIPLFALANSRLPLTGDAITIWLTEPISLGIVAGLVIGKTTGVLGAIWLASRTRLAMLPAGATWRQLLGLSTTAGIGFTVALFVSELAFDDVARGEAAKLGIFVGSMLAGVAGYLLLRTAPTPAPPLPDRPDDGAHAVGTVESRRAIA